MAGKLLRGILIVAALIPLCILAGISLPAGIPIVLGMVIVAAALGALIFAFVVTIQTTWRIHRGRASPEERASWPALLGVGLWGLMLLTFFVVPMTPTLWGQGIAFLMMPVLLTWGLLRWSRVRRAIDQGACPRCLYPNVTNADRCPECGRARMQPRSEPKTH